MEKKILIFGGDGYLGWPLAMHLAKNGFDVTVCDNFSKRKWELEIGVKPLISVKTLHERVGFWNANFDHQIKMVVGDVSNQRFIYDLFSIRPDIVINCADQPSSPFSMKGINTAQITQANNISSGLNLLFAIKKFCPEAHYVRLGANALIDFDKSKDGGAHTCCSYYELSKLHDCNNIRFASRNWGIKSSIVNTGVLYNDRTEETLLGSKLKTSLYYDRVFGTVVNRFCVQAVLGIDLTIYGDGSQLCAFSNLQESVHSLAGVISDSMSAGEFRICNNFRNVMTIEYLAKTVRRAAERLGITAGMQFLDNPRRESVDIRNSSLGRYVSSAEKELNTETVDEFLRKIVENRNNILADTILPTIKWAIN